MMYIAEQPEYHEWRCLKEQESEMMSGIQQVRNQINNVQLKIKEIAKKCNQVTFEFDSNCFNDQDQLLVIDSLKNSQSLMDVKLIGNFPRQPVFDLLLTLPNLTFITMTFEIFDELNSYYEKHQLKNVLTNLEHITLHGTIANSTSKIPTNVSSVKVYYASIGRMEAGLLASYLENLNSLKSLKILQDDEVNDDFIDTVGVTKLLTELNHIRMLNQLSIDINEMNGDSLNALADFIMNNIQLSELDIIDRYLTSFHNLIHILSNHPNIESFQIFVTLDIITQFAHILTHNKIFQSIIIEFEHPSTIEQLKPIIDALVHNTTIIEITILDFNSLPSHLQTYVINSIPSLQSTTPHLSVYLNNDHESFQIYQPTPKLLQITKQHTISTLYIRYLILLQFIYPNDIMSNLVALLSEGLGIDTGLVNQVLMNRSSIGLLVPLSRNPCTRSELIRICSRWTFTYSFNTRLSYP
ncbi:hypothetical protein BC833DRAFT_612122 [Globomyces pollinis-pini]|nr:hypothetical protein BC833DRAFT_612122 [Globomyces pollinis-pini]